MPFRAFAFAILPFAFSPALSQSPVRALTFNIRYGTANDGAHRWPNRSAHVIATIRDHAPHILGIQEALRGQLDELARALPGYRELGVGREDGKTAGEYAALLIDTLRFTVVSHGHFWYSDTPDAPSKHWGNNVIRICTWARLADRATGDTIRVYNSHWDHESQPSREKSAALLLQRVAADASPNDRLLVMADFNADETNAAYRALISDARTSLTETFRARHPDATVVGTFNSFRGDSTGGKIDAILAGPGWTVLDASIDRRRWGPLWASDHFAVSATLRATRQTGPGFEPVQPEQFALGTSMLNAWADFDNDADLDLFVGFNGRPNRLYRNDGGTFTDVAADADLADARATRGAAWGDFDGDGDADLVVGFAPGPAGSVVRLFRNDRGRFVDATAGASLAVATGAVRQMAWIDFDSDGDLDLFVAFRDRANTLFLNENGSFRDVAPERGVADSLRTVGAVWFDYDEDGDLDVVVANMDGQPNRIWKNTDGRFEAVMDVQWGGRAPRDSTNGTVRVCAEDVDGDGRIDLFFANYGPNGLFLNRGGGRFEDVSQAWGIAIDGRYDACAFADYDNDGKLDLYVNGTVTGGRSYPDYLFHNTGSGFTEVTPANIKALQADHGVQWADFDRDGAIDLALTGSRADGMHSLLRNTLPPSATRSALSVFVAAGADGRTTRPGAEVRVYAAGTRRLLGTRLVDTGSGYDTQNVMPVHFGVPGGARVDVEVTVPFGGRRTVTRVENVDPGAYRGRDLIVRVPAR